MEQSVLVTGATKGIGRACAEALAKAGFALFLNARNAEELAKTAALLPLGTRWHAADLALPHGRADLLRALPYAPAAAVLNVGAFVPKPLLDDAQGLEVHLNANFFAAEGIALGLMRRWKKEGIPGKLVLINSVASYDFRADAPGYSLAKGLLNAWAKAMQKEVLPLGIQLCQIHPSATKTASWEGIEAPSNKLLAPEEVAQCVLQVLQARQGLWFQEISLRPGNPDFF